MTASDLTGFYGKLPARGDFVRFGLSATIIDALDGWMRGCLAVSHTALSDDWADCWMDAPVWRFRIAIDNVRIGGIWLPSMDKVGRWFPLLIAADAASAGPLWLDAAEALGFAAVTADLTPDALATQLAAIPPDHTHVESGWWTIGAPRKQATRIALGTLPSPADFVAFLVDTEVAAAP